MNCLSFMKTKFFKSLLYFGKGTMHVTSSVFGLIPLLDFNKPWVDDELYDYFKLSNEDVLFIESLFSKE